ncbi:MAG: biphenyl 2,3-dioxygenase, partial [Pseudomonadales bacterium]
MDIRSLGYVVIEATDPEKWRDFGTNVIGMMEAPTMPDDGNVYLKIDARPFRFAITAGEQDRLLLCGWELRDQADFEKAKLDLADAGVKFEKCSAEDAKTRRVQELIRLDDPAGNTLELYYGADLDYAKFISPMGIAGFETGFNGDMGFGHAVLPAPNLEETHEFYQHVLGFSDSD